MLLSRLDWRQWVTITNHRCRPEPGKVDYWSVTGGASKPMTLRLTYSYTTQQNYSLWVAVINLCYVLSKSWSNNTSSVHVFAASTNIYYVRRYVRRPWPSISVGERTQSVMLGTVPMLQPATLCTILALYQPQWSTVISIFSSNSACLLGAIYSSTYKMLIQ